MLVNLVPEFRAVLAAPDRGAAYHEYFERHKPVLTSYWHNYVLEPESPHADHTITTPGRAPSRRATLVATIAARAAGPSTDAGAGSTTGRSEP